MKKIVLLLLLIGLISSCTSVQPMSESTKAFSQETQLSIAIPLRFYTWIKVENSNRFQSDVFNGRLDFEFDSVGDYLLKTRIQENKIIAVWGNQLLLQEGSPRYLVFTPFIASIYALEDNKEPLDIAFEVLKQILSDDGYKTYENGLIEIFKDGIKKYRTGGNAWEQYKNEHFIVVNKTIIIK